ncbi:MAG: thioredoxin family protein [Cyclobacteriaceae bacterium]
MRTVLITVLMLCSLISSAQMIDFEEPDWQVAMDKARKEGKLLMVYINTIWCEPCLEMEQGTFKEPEVHDYFSENFVNVPFDAEGFPGAEIADRYGVLVYPGFLFINAYGELVHKGCGWMNGDEFIQLGKDALTESKTLMNFKKRFVQGERSAEFLIDLTYTLDAACENTAGLVDAYFKDLPEEKWVEEPAWAMINLNVYNPYSPQFEYLTSHYGEFSERYGKDTVDAKIYDVLLGQFIEIYEGGDLTLFANQALQRVMADLEFAQKDELKSMVELQYSELIADWELYANSVVKVIDEQQVTDHVQLNEFAWKFYLYVEDQSKLDIAIGWMEAVLIEEKTATSLDTYASLLFKSGRVKEAIKWEKDALKRAEKELEELTHYQLQLEKFRLKSE